MQRPSSQLHQRDLPCHLYLHRRTHSGSCLQRLLHWALHLSIQLSVQASHKNTSVGQSCLHTLSKVTQPWCRFFKAQIQAGMLEKARENATQTWTVMAATAATELLRRFQPLARPPSFPAIDAFPALRKEAHAKFTSMEESATGKAWSLLLCGMGGIGKTTLAKAMYSFLSERIPDAR